VLHFAVLYVVLNTMSLCMYAYAPTIEFCTYRVMFLVLLQQFITPHGVIHYVIKKSTFLPFWAGYLCSSVVWNIG